MDIATVLRKSKVLAHEVESAELEQWSTWESLGYPTEQPVPLYRIWPLQLIGEFAGPLRRKKVAPIPLNYLPEYARGFQDGYECRESASLILDSLGKAEDSVIKIDTGDLHLAVGGSLYRGYRCVAVRAEVNAGKLIAALNAIRDNILNVTTKLLEQHRETVKERTAEPQSAASWQDAHSSALVVRNTTKLREEYEMEQAWARVRPMARV